jgi:hypothetical protein
MAMPADADRDLGAHDATPPADLATVDLLPSEPAAADPKQACMKSCTLPDSSKLCFPVDSWYCSQTCTAILNGFEARCGTCIAQRTQVVDNGSWCAQPNWSDTFLKTCTDQCTGNHQSTTAVDVLDKCDAFCSTNDFHDPGDKSCVPNNEDQCRAECRVRLTGVPNRCAACFLAASTRPTLLNGVCSREKWATVETCASYCR